MSRKLERARRGLPVTAESIYLSCGSWGPVSRKYATTLRRLTQHELHHGRMSAERFAGIEAATASIRSSIARLVGADPEAIALTRSTTASLAAVINELPWRAGDEVICTHLEHRACTEPLRAAARRHSIEVRLAHVPEQGADNLDWLAQCVTPRTRLIAFTGVSYTTGQRLPLAAIGAFGRAQGIATLTDAAQYVGAMALDLPASGIDFCAFPLQKWLGGAEGLGALYVRDPAYGNLRQDRVSQSRPALEATAEHLDWLDSQLGWDWILDRIPALASQARAAFGRIDGVSVITPPEHAGLVTIECSRSHEAIAAKLRRRKIVLRSWPDFGRYRLSLGYFNTDEEIAAAAAAFR